MSEYQEKLLFDDDLIDLPQKSIAIRGKSGYQKKELSPEKAGYPKAPGPRGWDLYLEEYEKDGSIF